MISNLTREYIPLDIPFVATVNGQRASNRASTTEQENAVRARRGYTLDPGMTCEVTWEMFSYEFGTFQNWWEEQLNNGLKWFWMQLPSPDGLEAWCLVRFVEPYEMVPAGFDQNTVTAQLELRDRYVRTTRPYAVPAQFDEDTLDSVDTLWADVMFAAPYNTATQLNDIKFAYEPEEVLGTVDIATGTGEEPAEHAYVHGDEASVDYGAQETFDLRGQVGWCIECWFQHRGGEKDSVVWNLYTTSSEPDNDPYASSYGLAVRRGQLYAFFDEGVSQTRLFEAALDNAVLPADGWYHCFVQERKGFLEIGVAPLGALNGTVTVLAPQLFTLPIYPRLVVGKDSSEFQYERMRYYTGKVDDLRITSAVRYA